MAVVDEDQSTLSQRIVNAFYPPTFMKPSPIGLPDMDPGMEEFLRRFGILLNRDECRRPMQWDAGVNAGFSHPESTPWLPLHAESQHINVAAQVDDEASLLRCYRRLLALRHLRRPFWPETVDQRVSNLWQLMLVGLRDAHPAVPLAAGAHAGQNAEGSCYQRIGE